MCQQNEDVIKKREVAIKELQSELDRQAQIAAMIHNLSSGKVPITNFAGKSSWPWFNMLSVSFFLSFFPLFLPCRLSLYPASFPRPRPRPRPPQYHRHRHYPRIIIIDIILGRKLSDECPLQTFSFIVPFCSQNCLSMLRFLSVFSLNRLTTEQ